MGIWVSLIKLTLTPTLTLSLNLTLTLTWMFPSIIMLADPYRLMKRGSGTKYRRYSRRSGVFGVGNSIRTLQVRKNNEKKCAIQM